LAAVNAAAAPYVGNGHYCYANAATMLLASVGERVAPELVEVLSGVGLGAIWLAEPGLLFLGYPTAPDVGLSRALDLLGFTFAERFGRDTDAPPWAELGEALTAGPAVLGPLDMGELTYRPRRENAAGADHYVLVYALDDAEVHLHDPAGFPHVSLPLVDLARAWRAERVGYRRGAFRWWSAPSRVRRRTSDEILDTALPAFAEIYRQADARQPEVVTGRAAIRTLADRVRCGEVTPRLAGHMSGFLFQLAARRALDYAAFFEARYPALAEKKREQAALSGRCHTLTVRQDWPAVADRLNRLADAEDQFRTALLAASVARTAVSRSVDSVGPRAI
jgi:hypothetical protein